MNKLKSLQEVKAQQAQNEAMSDVADSMKDFISGQTPEQFANWVQNLPTYERNQWESRMSKAKTTKKLNNPFDNTKIGGYY